MGRKAKTFRQDGQRLHKCPCGAEKMVFIPAGFSGSSRMYKAMCEGCGFVVHGHSCSGKSVHNFKDSWNSIMAKRQELTIPEVKREEENEEDEQTTESE